MTSTFPQLLLGHASARPSAPALREKKYGIWQTHSWADLARLVGQLAGGLHLAGLRRGEHVALIGANRPRLYATMLAAQALGAVAVALYQDAVAAECLYPLTSTGARFCLAEDQEQVDKLLELRAQLPELAHIWFDDARGLRNYRAPGLAPLDALIAAGAAHGAAHPDWFGAQVAGGRAQDVAALFFTSGTTGNPKGVVHTHASLLDRACAGAEFDRLTSAEEVLAYLPPAWIGQNIFSYAQWLACGYVVNCPESAATVAIDLREIGPSYYFAPPRVFEAMLTDVTIRMCAAGALKRRMFDACMALARRVGPALMAGSPVPAIERIQYAVGNLLVYGPLRNALGFGRLRVAYTAGEAIGPELFSFYRSIGINLKQLYGSTETAVFVCMQPDGQVRADTVGKPVRGVQLRIAADGEVLVRSPGLLRGYHGDAQATAAALDAHGWYHTGDAGFIDACGQLKIIDRVRDVGRLRGGAHDGALFAPKYLENKLKFFAHIKEAVALGDGRAQVCALLNIDFDAVGNWAERRKLPYAGYADLAQKSEVYDLLRGCVEAVNADLAADRTLAGCQVQRFVLLHKELDADDGELTRTNKVRRGFIAEKYAPLVDALYCGRSEQFISTPVRFEDGRSANVSATLKIAQARVFEPREQAA